MVRDDIIANSSQKEALYGNLVLVLHLDKLLKRHLPTLESTNNMKFRK